MLAEKQTDVRGKAAQLIAHVVDRVRRARVEHKPFFHLRLDHVFPDDIYAAMLRAMPAEANYRPLAGRSNENMRSDGSFTRVKIDLFPEYIRHLSPEQQPIWDIVGRALCSSEVQNAFIEALAEPLQQRFGKDFRQIGMYPIPVLTRDTPGYSIIPHVDTPWKGITVQLYLPGNDKAPHLGTVFHNQAPDGALTRGAQMPFVPNSGYAFAVVDGTVHSADTVGNEVQSRDSILLTYFVDAGLQRFLRNRGKRWGNFVLNEMRSLARR